MKTYSKILLCLILTNGFNLLSAKTIRYVKVDGTGDGTSWANASNSIQTMLDNSASGDEVWVAKGTYYPTTESIARDNRSRSFVVKEGVNFYGGFAGNETEITQRVLADLNADGEIDAYELTNKTLLSGDIDGVADIWTKTTNTNGTWRWTITGNESNCYRVVTSSGYNRIDGFTVIGGNANTSNINTGGGIYCYYYFSSIANCTISNCSATKDGGGIYSFFSSPSSSNYALTGINNCTISNCAASNNGGGIYCYTTYNSYYSSPMSNCTVSNCSAGSDGGGIYSSSLSASNYSSRIDNCTVRNCSAGGKGGGIYYNSSSSSYSSLINNCAVSNCSSSNFGGGIYSFTATSRAVANCTVSNCFANSAGGILSSTTNTSIPSVINCTVNNCSASSEGGGISSSSVTNCAVSNNKIGNTVSNIIGSSLVSNISPDITTAYVNPTSFVGVATTEAQELELKNANWRLKEGSPCINAGTSTNISSILSEKDIDNNPRVALGSIDIGAYEYQIQTLTMPAKEDFNNLSDWNSSNVFYKSTQLNGSQDIKWSITNQKVQFSWQTNLTSTYSHPFFSYQVDATNSTKVYLRYDMFYQAYAGTISPLGTEKLNIEYSNDFVIWSNIATYTNANGTIANQTYKHDLSNQLAGKKFFIRFNAKGENSNRIEKWEIDNVIIDADGLSAVDNVQGEKYKYSVNNGVLSIGNLEHGVGIQMYDINGRLIKTIKSESNTAHLALPVKGVYLVKVSSVSGVENKKMVW